MRGQEQGFYQPRSFAEVAAVPSRPPKGQHVLLFFLRADDCGQQTVKKAISLVERSLAILTQKFGQPKISLVQCIRYNSNGKMFKEEGWGEK